MSNIIDSAEEILHSLKGFHIYSFDKKAHIKFASRNLCELLGVSENQLLDENEDKYSSFIHPEDRMQYSWQLEDAAAKNSNIQLQYRLIGKNKNTIFVNDNITFRKNKNGSTEAFCVLFDITKIKEEQLDLQLINEALPCGFIRCTCEKHPKITYANQKLLNILHFPKADDEEMDYYSLYKDNIYLLIAPEERSRLAYCLQRISSEDAPMAGEITVVCCDGKKARLFGWVSKHTDENGSEELIGVCMDITERYIRSREKENSNYIRALTDVYDKIFEYDYSENTVKCLYWSNRNDIKWLQNIPMQMEDATEKWIASVVFPDDRKKMAEYFKSLRENNLLKAYSKPYTINYKELFRDDEFKTYMGIFLKTGSCTGLFCTREMTDHKRAEQLRDENESLKNMQQLVMRFSEGISAFRIKDEMVTPLYSSDNICEFFGYSKEEWLSLMKEAVPVRQFVSRGSFDYESFAKLMSQGEGEFTYFDVKSNTQRHIKAITSLKSPKASTPFYVMLYNVDERKKQNKEKEASKIFIRTFGYFDVFVDGKPIAFRNEKSKELFALLVDRRGGFITSEEAIGFLWEDEPVDSAAFARYRKVALKLKNLLEEYSIASIIESVNGKRRLDMEMVDCDLYNYLSGREEYKNLFKGSYLTNYSWGENTLAELMQTEMKERGSNE